MVKTMKAWDRDEVLCHYFHVQDFLGCAMKSRNWRHIPAHGTRLEHHRQVFDAPFSKYRCALLSTRGGW